MSNGMQAVVYDRYGRSEEVVSLDEQFPPAFIDKDSNHVLVKVFAASLTHKDIRVMHGDFKSVHPARKFPIVLGGDVSGIVQAVGDSCRKFQVGDEVIGMLNHGAIAEYVSGSENQFVHKPKKISHLHAAAFPYSGVLAFQCLHVTGKLEKDQKILILNGSGGVGSLAVQMAKYKGAKVYATASTHLEMVESLGADVVLDYTKCQWWEQLRGQNFDLIFDCAVGYPAWKHAREVLSDHGKYITIVPDVNEGPIEYFNFKIGIKIRSMKSGGRYTYIDSIDITKGKHLSYIAKMVSQGYIKPVLDPDSPYDLTRKDIRSLLLKLEQRKARGKLIINIAAFNGGFAGLKKKSQV